MSEILFTASRPSRPKEAPEEPAPRRRLGLRSLSAGLIAVGALALLDAGITLVWQEPVSALYAELQQDRLSGALRQVERAQPTPVERHQLARLPRQGPRISFLAHELRRGAAEGSAVGRIRIPKIGVSFVVVKGTQPADLKNGPGIYAQTSFPGAAGTTAIAGHRTTYLAPFRHVDALRRGNRIVVEMPYARLTYTVTGQRIVAPTNVRAAVADVGYSRLVLSACTPLYSAAQRLLVYARLTQTVALGAARHA